MLLYAGRSAGETPGQTAHFCCCLRSERVFIMATRNTIVYTTGGGSTVTIDYNETLHLFLSREEHLPFSAGRILQMLNLRTQEVSVVRTGAGLRIFVGEVCCLLTQQATNVLAAYWRNELQEEFPLLHRLFTPEIREGGGCY